MQKNIDQQFREAITQLDSSPAGLNRNPEANWAEMQAKLDAERRKRRGAWLWIGAAASVAVLIIGGWALLPQEKTPENEPIAMNTVPEQNGQPMVVQPMPAVVADSVAFEGQQEQQQQKLPVNSSPSIATNGATATVSNATTSWAAYRPSRLDLTVLNQNAIATGGTVQFKNPGNVQDYTYHWTKTDEGQRLTMGPPAITTPVPFLYLGTGTHTNGDAQFRQQPIAQNAPSVTAFFNTEPDAKSGQLQLRENNATVYKWDFGDGDVANKNLATGTYDVVVTNANGCCSGKQALIANNSMKVVGKKGEFDGGKVKLKESGKKGCFAIGDSISFAVSDPYGGESYAETVENAYFTTTQEPLSTFSIDVDRASYTNHRRYVEAGQLPPKYSVRAEEFINYFDYNYPQPHGGVPFSILPEVTTCPWNPRHNLVRIALKGREVATENVPASNIVFLLDVSGSMSDADKLPLLKQAMGMLTEKLREQDKVSIVVYAGAAGLVLPPTSGSNKQAIMAALNRLEAGGSTAGGQGIELAYATAKQNFIQGGNNRVVLATDGDFNVGTSDETGLEKLIVKKREEGVFLSVLGFGEGNLQDSKMELLADKGNGNYNYIDSDREAHKVLVSEFGGTLYTIAKDVKIQVEFNPAKVQSYRLVGYENRKLRNEDFANDKIDAGELGAGHTVTALYEVVPAESGWSSQPQDLKYQQHVLSNVGAGNEILTVKLRYKDPDGSVSKLLEETLVDDGRNIAETSADFRWAVAAAEYALILRQSDYKGLASFEQVLSLARSAIGPDKEGIRKEFIALVTKAAATTHTAKGN